MQREFKFYNRKNEIQILLESFETHVVKKEKSLGFFIQGRTGVGKTRLIREFINHIENDKSIASQIPKFNKTLDVFQYSCAKDAREPYLPFVRITQQIKKSGQKYRILQRLAMLALALFPIHDVVDDLQKLAEEIESEKSAEEVIKQKELKIFSKYLKTLKSQSRKAPLIIHIQNVQWIDLHSLDLLRALLKDEKSFWGMIILEESEIGACDETIKNKLDLLIEKEQLKRLTLKPLGKGYEIELLEQRFQPNLFTASEFEYIYTLSEGCPGILQNYVDEWIKNKFLYQENGIWKKIHGFEERIKPPYQKLLDLIITFLQDGEISAREQNLINNFAQEWTISNETVSSMIDMILKCRGLGYEIEGRVHSGSIGQDAFLAYDQERNRYIIEYVPNVPEMDRDISPREVKHPKLLPAKKIIRSGDSLLIVNDYFSGKTLRELRDEAHETHVSNVLRMAVQIAEGLAELHRNNFVHGYLRPEAIIRTDEGEIRVAAIDASQFQFLESKDRGKYLNFLAYQSPEQIDGGEVDFRSDIFSFGVLLFEMLTGELPFTGERKGELKQNILYAPLPDLDRIRPSIHPAVQAILRKCLQKDPNDRYESAEALVSDLKKVILEPVREPGPPLSSESKKVSSINTNGKQIKKRAMPIAIGIVFISIIVFLYIIDGINQKQFVPDTIVIHPFETAGKDHSRISPSILEYLIVDDIQQSSKKTLLTPGEFRLLYGESGKIAEVSLKGELNSKSIGYDVRLHVKRANSKKKDYMVHFNDPGALLGGVVQKMTREILGQFSVMKLKKSTFTRSWDAFECFYKGEKAWEKLETTKSKQNYEAALNIDPNFVLAKLRLAQVLTFEGNQIRARNIIQEIKPSLSQLSFIDSLRAVALDKRLQGDLRGQIDILREIYNNFPTRKEAPYEVAESYYQICDIRNAIDYYQKSLKLDPNFARAHNHIGYCYSHLGRHQEAIRHFKRYVELDSTANSYDSMGDGYMACGKLDSAAWAKRQGIRLDSTIDYLYQGLCYIYARQGRLQDAENAVKSYREFTSGPQNLATAHFLEAYIKYMQRDYNNALDSCQKAIQTFDSQDIVTRNHDLHWLIALIYSRLGQWENFRNEKGQIDSLVAVNHINATNYVMGIYKYSRLLEAIGQAHIHNLADVMEVIAEFDGPLESKIKDHGSNFGPVYLNTSLAEIIMRYFPNRPDLAEARLRQALAYNSNYALAHYDLWQLYGSQGKSGEAAQEKAEFSSLWENSDVQLRRIYGLGAIGH